LPPDQSPDQLLHQLLSPLYELSDQERDRLDDVPDDPELLNNENLLAFHQDRTPVWWPQQRAWNGGNWSPKERKRVLLERLRELLPEDFPLTPSSRSDVQHVVNSLRHIAHGLTIEESGILNL
jgi:hypothetical protein